MKLAFILGTRPEIIKLSPVIRSCMRRRTPFFIIHTNQHYSENLDRIFFEELELPQPKYNLHVGSGSHVEQIGKILIGVDAALRKEKPDVVIVQGDTNSVFAGAFAAERAHIPVAHVEAGLRSYDERMPEEINRVLTDHLSRFLFAPTTFEKKILTDEGIPKNRIFVTGNTIVDAIHENRKIGQGYAHILKKLKIIPGGYMLLTLHRPENVDIKSRLTNIFRGLAGVHAKWQMPILFPIHPRTKKQIRSFSIKLPHGVIVVEPVGFLEFLYLEGQAKLILTDSGGIQEEACILHVPCVTLRENTERPETIAAGGNVLGGIEPARIVRSVGKMIRIKGNWRCPLGNGDAGEKILKILLKNVKV